MKFGVMIADPPWDFSDGLRKMKRKTKRSARSQYETMSVSEIAELDVKSVIDPKGCVLALWVPSSLLQNGIQVMNAWGFVLKQTFVWVKTKPDAEERLLDDCELDCLDDTLSFGMGRLFRQSHEIVLVGTVGKVYDGLADRSQRSVMLEPVAGHSTKPDELHYRLEMMFPDSNKLELFARRQVPGWACVGNEVNEGRDVRDVLQELKTL